MLNQEVALLAQGWLFWFKLEWNRLLWVSSQVIALSNTYSALIAGCFEQRMNDISYLTKWFAFHAVICCFSPHMLIYLKIDIKSILEK